MGAKSRLKGTGEEAEKCPASAQSRRRFTPPLLQSQAAFKAVCYVESNGSLRALDVVKSLSLPCFSVSRKTKMQIRIKKEENGLEGEFFLSLSFFFSLVLLHEKKFPFSSHSENNVFSLRLHVKMHVFP